MHKRLLGLFFIFLSFFSVFGQVKSEVIQQRIEFISEQLQSESIDLTNYIEQFNYFFDHPINLNETNGEDLEELGLLTSIQINDLLLHRKLFGKFISVYELQSLTYWDLSTIQLILPFIRIEDKLDNLHISFKEALKGGKYETFLRYQPMVEQKGGYVNVSDSVLANSNNYYKGNGDRYYTRFRYTYKTNISVGVTAEKDAGEQFFKGTQKNGFDFYSAHAFFKGGKYLRSAVIGDYQIQIGQGLNLWSSYAFGKTSDFATMKRTAIPIRPYTSVDEARFMRGIAVDCGYRNFSLLAFASSKRVDASSIPDSTFDDLEFISTIDLSGLHRTNREIDKMNALRENIAGLNFKYSKAGLRIGLAGVYQGYDKPFNKSVQLYNQFDFRGQHNFSYSADYSYNIKNINVFGEVSKVWNTDVNQFKSGWAMVHGAMIALDPKASIGLLYRDYQKDYQTFYNAGFSEGSNTQNEQGLYAGIKLKPATAWSLVGYVDIFKFPWMKYGVDASSKGHEFLVQSSYKPNKIFEIYVRYRQQLREKNSRSYDGNVTPLEDVLQRNYRFNLSYVINESFTFKSRIELVSLHRNSSGKKTGMLIAQDLLYKPKSFPFDFSLRYALFDTEDYDTRLYAFENNALYAFAVPAYYYQGSRAYLLIRYSFLRHCDLWVRYGVFLYNNRTSISSGSEGILGSRKTDLIVQLRITL
ncbi:MAG: hypothetical protein NT109_09120 [Flavobacteriia bacterium]|nr:hypothetical protein [Flavobacteriia bacterium]